VFEAPENALRDRRLRPAWTAATVSGLAGQYRALRRRHPDALLLIQVGNRWRLPVSRSPDAIRGRTTRPASQPSAQTGHFKTGFKRRELVSIWRPPGAPSFLSAARTVI
jgi:hypothetical protein